MKPKQSSDNPPYSILIFNHGRKMRTAIRKFKSSILAKFDLCGTLRKSTAYLLILLVALQSNFVIAASPDKELRSKVQHTAKAATNNNDKATDPAPDYVNRTFSWLFGRDFSSASEPAITESITAFGPKRFNRTNGAPNNYVETFSMPANSADGVYTLTILNGESNGTNRISSAVIKLNGGEVFLQSEFNQNVYILEKPVVLAAQNTLEIRLASSPGSYLSIKVSGENCGTSDNVPPQIVISSPVDNTAMTAATIGLSGTAEDIGANASGISQVLVNDVQVSYNATTKTWSLAAAPLAIGTNIFTAKAIDVAGNESTSQVTVIRDLTSPAISVVSPSNNAVTLAETIAISGNAADSGSDASGLASVKVNGTDAVLDLANGNWSLSSVALNVGDNTFTAVAVDRAGNQASGQIVVRRVVNQPPTANAGSDQTIELPNTASLAGHTSDDGYPIGSTILVGWSKVSGNGAVVFANPSSLQTSASFSGSGIYVLRLTATDGSLSASDELTVTVYPENQAPTVNAGADRTIQLPNTVALSGTVGDDGYPVGSALSAQWSKFSGTGNVTFSTPTNQQTDASFSQAGNYILRLSVTDGQYTVFDDMSVVVSAANQAPVADFSVPSAGGPMGMNVVSFSSASPDNSPSKLLDESTFSTWVTANTQPNQFATFELTGGEQLIQSFRFQQANFPTSYMVKDFIVQVSTTASDDASFSTVLTGTFQANTQLQEVFLPTGAVHARFVKLITVNTHGSPSPIAVSTFQVIGAGMADSIVSLPGTLNAAKRTSPSFLRNGAAISRFSSFQVSGPGGHPVGLITDSGTWLTTSKVNEFVVIKLGGDGSHSLKGIRLGGNYNAGINYWVKDFEIWISNTVDDDAAFTKVLDGVKTTSETQDYIFPGGPVPARYIKYVPKSNRDGSTAYIANMGIEAIAVDAAGIHSFSSDYENSRVEEAFDNNPQSGWYCSPGALTNQWVKVRLDGTVSQKIYGVRIGGSNSSFGNFGPRDYQIRISNTTADDAAFTTIHTGTLSTSPAMQEIRFAQPADAKYVQFYWVNGHSASSWLSVYELEVLSLAKDGATLTGISSQGDMTVPAARVLDLDQGPNYSQWYSVSGQNTNQNLTLRLYDGAQFDINHVALRPGFMPSHTGTSPKDFDIQVSTTDDSNTSFSTVFSGTLQSVDLLQHFYFPTAPARYVRLLISNNYGGQHVTLNTLFVFAKNTGATDARFFDRSTDPDGTIVSYHWDFGDGFTSSGRSPVHTYAQEGVYNVSLTVTDSGGATTTTVRPYHALPTLKADFSYSPEHPTESDFFFNSVNFVDRSSSRLNNAGGVAEIFARGTNNQLPTQGFLAIMYPDNGSYPATIRFGADYVLNYRTTKNVAVQNLPPSVNVSDGKTVYWGENWTNTIISLGDPGPADRATLSGVWNFGDGTNSTCTNCTVASAQGVHSYALPGSYNAVLTITDKDGGSGSDSATYSAIKRPTSIVFSQPTRNGDQLTITGTLFDTYGNLTLAGKPIQINLNGVSSSLTTGSNGVFQTTLTLRADVQNR